MIEDDRHCSRRRARRRCSRGADGPLAGAARPGAGGRSAAAARRSLPSRRDAGPLALARTRPAPGRQLLFANGLGGFTRDGREYVITLRAGLHAHRRRPGSTWSPTPASASWSPRPAAGYTWAGNSQMNRLTPWSNDPVSDPPGEVVYLRDEETGEFWSPTPLPVRGRGDRRSSATARATPSSRERSHGLEQDLPRPGLADDPVKTASA